MKKLLFTFLLLASAASARERFWSFCEQGAVKAVVSGLSSTNTLQGSYPSCTVRVTVNGTGATAALYADNVGTPLANPFTANNKGYFFFYADDGRYDVQLSAGGLPAPWTIGDIQLITGHFNASPSLLDFHCVGDGVTNDTACVQSAVNSLQGATGELVVNGGKTFCVGSIVIGLPLVITGTGTFKRCVSMPSGVGLLDITATNVTLQGFSIDGQTTTPTQVSYLGTPDPFGSMLDNTSIWIHGGSSNILVKELNINHTGGDAGIVDARSANVSNVSIIGNTVTNSRSTIFGIPGDYLYGGWTGGFYFISDGFNFSIDNLNIERNRMLRITGNAIWGHSSALNLPNTNIRVVNNWCEDAGLDCIQMANVLGGTVSHNYGKRIGYVPFNTGSPATDVTFGTPRWINESGISIPPVFLDTSGKVNGVDYTDNSADAINGGWMDGDGYGFGTVRPGTGTSCWLSNDPHAQSGLCGPGSNGVNASYGWNSGNTNVVAGADTFVELIGGVFNGFGSGAVRFYGCTNCKATGLTINHPTTAMTSPFSYGPIIVSGNTLRANNIQISGNTAYWSPVTGAVVSEDAQYAPFIAGDVNLVYENQCIGTSGVACFQLFKNNNSSTTSGPLRLSSVTPQAQGIVESLWQTEGVNGPGYSAKLYANINGTGTFLFDCILTGCQAAGSFQAQTIASLTNGYYVGVTQIVDGSRNLANIHDATITGQVTLTGLTAGSGGTVVCIDANHLFAGGCGGGGGGTITGSGTTNTLTKWTGTTAIGNSSITDNGTQISTSEAFTTSANLSGGAYYLNGATQIITTGGDVGNIHNIVNSGQTTTTGNISGGAYYIAATQIVNATKDIGNIRNFSSTGSVTLTGLTAGSGGSVVCINANILYAGGCSGGGSGVSGSGTTGKIPIWTAATALGDSGLADSGTLISTSEALTVAGTVTMSGNASVGGTFLSIGKLGVGSASTTYGIEVHGAGNLGVVNSDGGFFTGSVGATAVNVPNGTVAAKNAALTDTAFNTLNVANGGINTKNLTVTQTVTFTGLTAGSGGSVVCVNANVLYAGGCGGGGSGISGSGTTGKIPIWTAATALGDSGLSDNGTTISTAEGIVTTGSAPITSGGNMNVGATLNVVGNSFLAAANFSGAIVATSTVLISGPGLQTSAGVPITTGAGGNMNVGGTLNVTGSSFLAGANFSGGILATSTVVLSNASITMSGLASSGTGSVLCITAGGLLFKTACGGGGGTVTGSGTTGFVPIWTSSSSLGNSGLQDSGTLISTTEAMTVNGTVTMVTNASVGGTFLVIGKTGIGSAATTYGLEVHGAGNLGVINSDGGFFTGSTGSTAINVPNGTVAAKDGFFSDTATNTVNVPNGGVTAGSLAVTGPGSIAGTVTLAGLTNGSGGQVVCVNATVLFKGGCSSVSAPLVLGSTSFTGNNPLVTQSAGAFNNTNDYSSIVSLLGPAATDSRTMNNFFHIYQANHLVGTREAAGEFGVVNPSGSTNWEADAVVAMAVNHNSAVFNPAFGGFYQGNAVVAVSAFALNAAPPPGGGPNGAAFAFNGKVQDYENDNTSAGHHWPSTLTGAEWDMTMADTGSRGTGASYNVAWANGKPTDSGGINFVGINAFGFQAYFDRAIDSIDGAALVGLSLRGQPANNSTTCPSCNALDSQFIQFLSGGSTLFAHVYANATGAIVLAPDVGHTGNTLKVLGGSGNVTADGSFTAGGLIQTNASGTTALYAPNGQLYAGGAGPNTIVGTLNVGPVAAQSLSTNGSLTVTGAGPHSINGPLFLGVSNNVIINGGGSVPIDPGNKIQANGVSGVASGNSYIVTTAFGGPTAYLGADNFSGHAFAGSFSNTPFDFRTSNSVRGSISAAGLFSIVGTASNPSLAVSAGFIQSAEGFFSTSSAFNALNLPSGGIVAGGLGSATAGSKAVCMVGTTMTVSPTGVCP